MVRRFSVGKCCCGKPICPVCHPDRIPTAFRVDILSPPVAGSCGANCNDWYASFHLPFCGYEDWTVFGSPPESPIKKCHYVFWPGPCPAFTVPNETSTGAPYFSGLTLTLAESLTPNALDIQVAVDSQLFEYPDYFSYPSIPTDPTHNCLKVGLGTSGHVWLDTIAYDPADPFSPNCWTMFHELDLPGAGTFDNYYDTDAGPTRLCIFGVDVVMTPEKVPLVRVNAISA